MPSNVSEFMDYYNENEKRISDAMEAVNIALKLQGEKRMNAIDDIENRTKDIKTQMSCAEIEILSIVNSESRTKCSEMQNTQKAHYQELLNQLKYLKVAQKQEEQEQETHTGPVTDFQKVKMAVVLYDDAKVNLNDANRAMSEVITLNTEIESVLSNDLIKLNRINDDLTGIQSESQLAKKQLRQLAMRVVSNKLYMGVFMLVVIVLLALAIWNIVAPE